jgi:hypothetical protein
VAGDVDEGVGAGTLDEQVDTFIDGLVRRMESVPKTLAALTMRHALAGGARRSASTEDAVLFDDILTDILRQAQRRGEIRADADTREIGDILGGTTMDALQRWAGDRARRSLRDSLQMRMDLVLDGIRTRPISRIGKASSRRAPRQRA